MCVRELKRQDHFARPGADKGRIKYVRVWGERNSCTTIVTEILQRNLRLDCKAQGETVVRKPPPDTRTPR